MKEGKSIMEISKILKYDYKTILREVNNRKYLLLNSKTITHRFSIEEHICNLLNKNHKVWNKWYKFKRNTCTYDYVVYDSKYAQEDYDKRNKRCVGSKQILFLDFVSKCLNKNQSISHIVAMIYRKFNKTLSRQTIYDWVEKGVIKYNKKTIIL